jgi:hypothetical protein
MDSLTSPASVLFEPKDHVAHDNMRAMPRTRERNIAPHDIPAFNLMISGMNDKWKQQ